MLVLWVPETLLSIAPRGGGPTAAGAPGPALSGRPLLPSPAGTTTTLKVGAFRNSASGHHPDLHAVILAARTPRACA